VKNSLNSLTAAASFEESGTLSSKVAKGQLARLSHLARSLLSLGRPLKPQLASIQLEDVVKETVEGLKLMPESADVQTSLKLEQPAAIEADPALAATAVDNIVRNAIEAAVAAKDTGKTSEPRVQVTVTGATLTVEDNGGGPPPGFEAHAFEPFVTSKPKGVGLGLTTARQAIEASGGTIRFERIPGGTRFVLTFKPARKSS
jgi:signal transduction histidine kinase